MLGTERWLLQPALLSLGYSINTEDPAEIEEAKQLTIDAKRHLLQFNDTDFYARLDDGSASMVHAWDGWCNYATNKNVEFVVPSEGSDLFADVMAIMESSENKEAAHAFINFVLEAENHLKVAELVLYKVPNAPAMEHARSRADQGLSEPRDLAGRARRLRGGPAARDRGSGRLEPGGGGDQGRLAARGRRERPDAIRRSLRPREPVAPARPVRRAGLRVLARVVPAAGRSDPRLQLLPAERDRRHRLHVHPGQLRPRGRPAVPEGAGVLGPHRAAHHPDRARARLRGRLLHRDALGAVADPAAGADRAAVLDEPVDPHLRVDRAAQQRRADQSRPAGLRGDRRLAPPPQQRVRDRRRAALRLPAADDPAALRVDRAAWDARLAKQPPTSARGRWPDSSG